MLIYKPENARGFLEVHHTCFMLEWDRECEKLAKINFGEQTRGVGSVDIRINLRMRGTGRLPDFFYTNSHPIVSNRFKETLESIGFTDIEYVPTNLVGARINPRTGTAEDVSIDQAGIEIDREYYVLNVPSVSELLDRNATTMSNEFISAEVDSHPGIYIKAVFQTPDVPPLFVLPGQPFGLLMSEQFVKLVKKKGLQGLRAVEIMDTSKPNDLDMYPTDPANIVSMAEAWRQYERTHA